MSTSALSELSLSWTEAWLTVLTATGIYFATILFSRIFGQRQFATSSSYDMAFVFALGSVIGRVVLVRTSLLTAVLGLATLFVLHSATGWLHHHVRFVHELVQNPPILVVADGELLVDSLERAHVSRDELRQALRLAGVTSMDEVSAVVLERSGSLSVLRGDVEPDLLADVEGSGRVTRSRAA